LSQTYLSIIKSMLICDFISTCTILLVGYMVHMLILETSTVERMDNARTY
jgi:hypothetical protein